MKIVIIDYGAGNTKSVQFAFKRIGINATLTSDFELIRNADGIIFPGVGHANQAMNSLEENGLVNLIKSLKQPVLGICLGMQLLCEFTEEGDQIGLGIVPIKVQKFRHELPVPQIGWNQVEFNESDLFKGIENGAYFYFVHSYFVPVIKEAIGISDYGGEFTASLNIANFYACQFHPEKSSSAGEKLLKNFIEICESYQQ